MGPIRCTSGLFSPTLHQSNPHVVKKKKKKLKKLFGFLASLSCTSHFILFPSLTIVTEISNLVIDELNHSENSTKKKMLVPYPSNKRVYLFICVLVQCNRGRV